MTTLTPTVRPSAPAARGASFGNVVRAEWTKLWSVRSTRWTLIATVVATLGFTILNAWGSMSQWSHLSAADRASFDPTATALNGLYFGQLAVAVLGALVITAEYSTGGIRTTLTAVPARGRLLAAKAVCVAVVSLGIGLLTSFAAFAVAQPFFAQHEVQAHLGDPGVLRAVVGGGLYVLGCGLFGFAVGTVLRHSAGAITTAIGALFVLPLLTRLLPAGWGHTVNEYFFSNAGGMITMTRPMKDYLSPWHGYLVFTIEWLAVAVLGFVVMRRRDA